MIVVVDIAFYRVLTKTPIKSDYCDNQTLYQDGISRIQLASATAHFLKKLLQIQLRFN